MKVRDFTICQTKKNNVKSDVLNAVGHFDKYWSNGQVIKYAFMGGTTQQRKLVTMGINDLDFINLKFWETTDVNIAEVRIAFTPGGSWSYLGIDCLQIPSSSPTMNFGWLHKTNPTDIGTVKHELTHMIGAGHEHQFPNGITFILDEIKKDIPNWSDDEIIHNIINQSKAGTVDTTLDIDLNSIMLYAFPARWNKEGISTKQNNDWSNKDKEFWSNIYPINEIDYKKVLLTLYEDKNIRDLLKSTHVNVANLLKVDGEGRELEVINNIVNSLK